MIYAAWQLFSRFLVVSVMKWLLGMVRYAINAYNRLLQVWVATRVFLVVTKPPGSMSQHGFPCVAMKLVGS